MRVVAWNAQWAEADRQRGAAIRRELERIDADVIVLTEGSAALLPDAGSVIEGGADWGYKVDDPHRRKVLLWSRTGWHDVDTLGHPDLPPGRWASGRTVGALGEVEIAGVCVPWSGAHVSTGRRDRSMWQEHLRYLEVLRGLMTRPSSLPLVLAGDFNQRIPRTRQPVRVAEVLAGALDGFEVLTSGEVEGHRLIDHVAMRGLRAAAPPAVIHRVIDDLEVSDHDGVVVDLDLA